MEQLVYPVRLFRLPFFGVSRLTMSVLFGIKVGNIGVYRWRKD